VALIWVDGRRQADIVSKRPIIKIRMALVAEVVSVGMTQQARKSLVPVVERVS
jgi:hypothetical protein